MSRKGDGRYLSAAGGRESRKRDGRYLSAAAEKKQTGKECCVVRGLYQNIRSAQARVGRVERWLGELESCPHLIGWVEAWEDAT